MVKQHSPACAAASTAGAWNGCMALHRNDKHALDQDKVVAAMRAVLEDKLHARKQAMAAKLVAPTELSSTLTRRLSTPSKRVPYVLGMHYISTAWQTGPRPSTHNVWPQQQQQQQ